jgi:hypothetical protein
MFVVFISSDEYQYIPIQEESTIQYITPVNNAGDKCLGTLSSSIAVNASGPGN